MRTFVLTTIWINVVVGFLTLLGLGGNLSRSERIAKVIGVLAAVVYSGWGFWVLYGGR